MKTRLITVAIFAVCTPLLSHAESGDIYAVAKGGIMEIDYHQSKPNYVVGIYGGYSFNRNLSIEGEVNYSLAGGRYTDGSETGRFKILTAAGYGVHRSPITPWLYLKAKAGLLAESVRHTIDNIPTPTTPQNDIGLSGGLGIGTQVNHQLTIEAEYTMIEKNIAYLSMGVHYPF